ncbi:GTPase of the mitochondrial inner membrane that associates with the large ribosomal subunit [Orbilia oligospora]|uniref:GTPase of the mitochondrial inner membrane that associates with the large ribosomal subunit n=1 Tax=Orbilia oligospora TaxID=2813651 RepID=A0A7C8PI42_ORBOL|nr:GTPase of the mitochondrial inner membrane that associates with the large ribosomal subunit [Orbilia oligospora]TGJ63964.1 GTPase of the mitochondrial inner membrane that associates with the large ribosomal subunit [Orbilia oligospora]
MKMPPTTLLPFLYPHSSHRLFIRLIRQKSTLTPSTARSLLESELPTLTTPTTATAQSQTHLATDHRTPPFLDTLSLTLTSGSGGNGCVSFLREKFVSHGPPNGGDGGDGGDVYITLDEQIGSLHKLSRMKIVKAGRGSNGLGGARNGARGEDVVLKVPRGTIVRVLERGIDGRPLPSEVFEEEDYFDDDGGDGDGYYEGQMGAQEGEEGEEFIVKNAHDGRTDQDPAEILAKKMRRKKRIPRRFAKSNVDDPGSEYIHYPLSLAMNMNSPHWPPRKPIRKDMSQPEVFKIDFSKEEKDDNGGGSVGERGIAGKKRTMEPILLLKGGAGGYGNPNFITKDLRRPMWATKGSKGSTMKIQLELKLLADVGLVGRPNVGKSSLLRCITGSRARVGNWAFTTLKPNMGTVVLDKGLGTGDTLFGDEDGESGRERFTVADIPGLVKDAGENKGLGWDFLKHVERARGLVFVVDLGFDPVKQVEGLWRDIMEYEKMREVQRLEAAEEERRLREEERMRKEDEEEMGVVIKLSEEFEDDVKPEEGISEKPWMVVGNKADLEGAERRFMKLREYLDKLQTDGKVKRPIGCIAVSALRAGSWSDSEYEKESEVWKGVIQWFRSLVT